MSNFAIDKDNNNIKTTIMKKLIFTTAVMMAMTVSCFAQSKNIEPEYIGQVVILNADSTTVLLQKEAASMKTKSSNW